MQSDFWTDEKVEALMVGAGHGLSASALGVLLRCSRNAVIGKAHRLRLRLTGHAFSGGPGGGAIVEIGPERVASEIDAAADGKLKAKPSEPPQPKPVPTPRAETLFDLLPPFEPEGGVSIWNLEDRHCKSVLGDPSAMRYCGELAIVGHSWCAKHCRLYLTPRATITQKRIGRWA
jgi:hypothetical protein